MPSLKALASKGNVWLVILAYGISGGAFAGWGAARTINFKSLGIGDAESGRVGLVMVMACCAAALAFARLADRLRRHTKPALVALLLLSALSFLWLSLLCDRTLPLVRWQLYTSAVAGGAFTFACTPLFTEYAVELAYPVAEGVVGALLSLVNNLICFVFLMAFFLPMKSVLWVNYLLVASLAVAVPLVGWSRASYARLERDEPVGANQEENEVEGIDEDIII